MRLLPALLSVASLLVVAPRLASATPSYPSDIQTDLNLTYTPPCTVCHTSNAGGPGTATVAFAMAMKAHGLLQLNDPTVASALTSMDTAKVDSDCDGTPDVEQLKAGRDPTTGAYIDASGKTAPTDKGCTSASSSGSSATSNPWYGCAAPQPAQVAAGPTPWQGAAWIAAVVGVALARRRRS